MTGDTPDDLDARRVANEKVVREAIATHYAALPPLPPVPPLPPIPPYDAGFVMPGTPSDPIARVAPPAEPMMNEAGHGLGAANARMDRIEHSVEVLSGEISKVVGLVQKVSEKVDDRFNEGNERADRKALELVAASKTDFSKFSTPVTLVATVLLFLIGGFASYVELGVNSDFARVEKMIDKLGESVTKRADKVDVRFEKLVDDTIPRREAESRLSRIDVDLAGKVDKIVITEMCKLYAAQLSSLSSDVERLKNDVVSRREHEQHWADFNDRINTLALRLNEVAKASAGTPAIDTIRQLQDRVDALTNRFVAVPKFPVLPGSP